MHKSLLRVLRIEGVVGIKRVVGRGRIGPDKTPEFARHIPERLQLVRIGQRNFEGDRLSGRNGFAQIRLIEQPHDVVVLGTLTSFPTIRGG